MKHGRREVAGRPHRSPRTPRRNRPSSFDRSSDSYRPPSKHRASYFDQAVREQRQGHHEPVHRWRVGRCLGRNQGRGNGTRGLSKSIPARYSSARVDPAAALVQPLPASEMLHKSAEKTVPVARTTGASHYTGRLGGKTSLALFVIRPSHRASLETLMSQSISRGQIGNTDDAIRVTFSDRAIYLTPPAATYSGRAWERIIREH
jgi:hypothetical protein